MKRMIFAFAALAAFVTPSMASATTHQFNAVQISLTQSLVDGGFIFELVNPPPPSPLCTAASGNWGIQVEPGRAGYTSDGVKNLLGQVLAALLGARTVDILISDTSSVNGCDLVWLVVH